MISNVMVHNQTLNKLFTSIIKGALRNSSRYQVFLEIFCHLNLPNKNSELIFLTQIGCYFIIPPFN
jgi:hypothetical protein